MNTYNLQGVSLLSFKAGAAIRINRAVKLGAAAGEVIESAAIADLTIGIATQAAAAAGDPVPVQTNGVAKVLLGVGGVTFASQLMVIAADADGSVGTAAGATAKSIGVALETGLENETIAVLLHGGPNVNGPAST